MFEHKKKNGAVFTPQKFGGVIMLLLSHDQQNIGIPRKRFFRYRLINRKEYEKVKIKRFKDN